MENTKLYDDLNYPNLGGIKSNYCPECGSSNLFDLDNYFECDDCGFKWKK